MTTLDSIITEATHGSPEKALHDLETYLVPCIGRLPATQAETASVVNEAAAVFYLLRFVQLARYYPGGHKRVDLLHRAAGLMPSNPLLASENDQALTRIDIEA